MTTTTARIVPNAPLAESLGVDDGAGTGDDVGTGVATGVMTGWGLKFGGSVPGGGVGAGDAGVGEAAAAKTTTVPVISGWIEQWNLNVPAWSKTLANWLPGSSGPLSKLPSSAVTVCWRVPRFCHVTTSPAVIVVVAGSNALSTIPMVGDAAEASGARRRPNTKALMPRAARRRLATVIGISTAPSYAAISNLR